MGMKDKLRKVNPKVPPIIVMVVPILLAVLFVYQVYMPMAEEKAQLTDVISTLQRQVEEDRVKVRKMDELVAANQKLDQDLTAAREILPTSEEMAGLLENITKLVKESGLELKDWQKVKSASDASGLYTETVVNVMVEGSYHELGKFMERLDGITRIVTVSNLEMSSAKLVGYEMNMPIKFTIIAYSAAGGI